MVQRVLVVMLCFCSFVAADDTVLKLYRPFGEVTAQAPLIVKSKLFGRCIGQSQLIVREDAWRCEAGGRVYDPCFVKSGGNKKKAVCPQSPWTGDSVQVSVPSPLNNERHIGLDMSRAFPWAIELANGEYCQAIDPNSVYDGMPVRYRCSGTNVLIGYLQRCKAVWSMLEKTPGGVDTVELIKAWF